MRCPDVGRGGGRGRYRGHRHAHRSRPDGIGAIDRATTATLFLADFAGETPWAHRDIAGTMQSDTDDVWRSKGATGFGTRILIELARGFTPVEAQSRTE